MSPRLLQKRYGQFLDVPYSDLISNVRERNIFLDCIATDPSSTAIYGIASAYENDKSNDRRVLLLRSTSNPDHLSEGMWSILSNTAASPLSYGDQNFRTVDCAVSSKGVFTALYRNNQSRTPGSFAISTGVRYDPKTQAWSSIRTTPDYGWTSDFWHHQSFYVNKDGVESLVHLLSDRTASIIRFGVVDDTSNVLQLVNVWKTEGESGNYKSDGQSYPLSFNLLIGIDALGDLGVFNSDTLYPTKCRYSKGRLYKAENDRKSLIINSYTLSDATAPPPQPQQVLNKTQNYMDNYFFAGIRDDSTYLGFIGQYNDTSHSYNITTMNVTDGGVQVGPVNTVAMYGNNTERPYQYRYLSERQTVNNNFVCVGGHLPGQDPFVVGLTSEGLYEFAPNGRTLDAADGRVGVTVHGTFWSETRPRIAPDDYKHFPDAWAPEFTSWQIIGMFVGVVLVLFGIVKLIRRRLGRERLAKEIDDNPFFNSELAPSSSHPSGGADQEFAMGVVVQSVESTTSGEQRASPDTSTPSVPAASTVAPPTPTATATIIANGDDSGKLETSSNPQPNVVVSIEESDLYPGSPQLPISFVDSQAQELGLSTHPRPNVITSVGGANP